MQYLSVIEQGKTGYGGMIPELNITATGKSKEVVIEKLGQGLSMYLYQLQPDSLHIKYRSFDDLPKDVQDSFDHAESILIEPTQVNPVSLEVERVIKLSGLTDSEIARRMGSSPAGIKRLKDYFYWGHSLKTLRKLADVLTLKLEVKIL